MLPVFAIIGRPNVGKSTLFNFLTQSRAALVIDIPGVTRDRQYGRGVVGDRPYIVVDTGGIAESDADTKPMLDLIDTQVKQSIEEANCILFMVDAKSGLTVSDIEIAQRLRPYQDKVVLVINKVDSVDPILASNEFYQLGFAESVAIAAKGGRNVNTFVMNLLTRFPEVIELPQPVKNNIHIAVVGRPNVGKSTLVNRILGEERVLVYDQPGTTRDSIFIPFARRDRDYTLIDTAGIRRRSKVSDIIEKFSIVKTIQAIEQAHVVIVVINAHEGVSEQDLRLIGLVLQAGRGIVIAINKWDGLEEYDREQVKQSIERRLTFVHFARRYFISALHGTGVGHLYRAVDEAYDAAIQPIPTAELTKALLLALKKHQPPLAKGRRIRLRYAHLGGHHPFVIIIHGKQTQGLPGSYQTYLANFFREHFNLVGVPLQIQFKSDRNPFVEE